MRNIDILDLKSPGVSEEVKLILDATPTAVFIDDGNGDTLWINKACEELYEIDRKDIIGKSIYELEKTGIFTPSVARLVLERKDSVRIMHSNRYGKKLLTTGIPIQNEANDILKVVSTSNDITDLVSLKNTLENMKHELDELKEDRKEHDHLIFKSKKMLDVIQLAKKLSEIETTVLITGESGVGKGVISRFVHDYGARRDKPFVKINCGAIPDTLLESELFGYDEGAFTGSKKSGKAGLFELADQGTIFLDEIGEMPLHLQVKILQVLQDKEIQRIGGASSIPVDVRIIAATNKDLEKMVEQRTFREDLFYRLNVVPIHIPPLREREEDILDLTRKLLEKFNDKFRTKKSFHSSSMGILVKYPWPGNVRELENMIERLIITTESAVIKPEHLPLYMRENEQDLALSDALTLNEAVERVEMQLIKNAMAKHKSTRKAAKALNVSQPTIVRKMSKYDLKLDED